MKLRGGTMNITYVNPGFQAMIDSIMAFQNDGETSYWSEPLFHFFPNLDQDRFEAMSASAKKNYLSAKLGKIYQEQEGIINQKVNDYNHYWKKFQPQIEEALSDAFGIDVTSLFNDLRGEICLNPICPRFLQEKYFQIFYLNSERGALGMSLHEIIHYLWFYVWNEEFEDSYDEYERPSLKWILSEMVVESIMGDERLSSINPYYPGSVYDYFQTMEVDNERVLAVLDGMYRCGDIKKFMHDSYEYCLCNEEEIRAHIRHAEKE